jgi:hypothetical protein
MLTRPLSWIGAACVGAAVVTALGGADSKPADPSELVIRSPNGRARITLSAKDDGSASIQFQSRDGATPVSLEMSGEGQGTVSVTNGQRGVLITVNPRASAVELRDGEERTRVRIREEEQFGKSLVELKDQHGEVSFRAESPAVRHPSEDAGQSR